jgi:hypothetical protein
MSWIHKRTKSCPRCSNPIEVRLSKGQSLRQVNANPTIAEKWRLQPHEGFCQLLPALPLSTFIHSFNHL